VKIGFGPRAVGSVGGRSSTAGCRGHPWGRRFRHQARHPAFVGVVALPGHVAHGLRGVVRPHPFRLEGSQRHRRLSRPIWSPAVKVAAAAKIAAAPSVVVNVVLVVAPSRLAMGGSESLQPTTASKQSAARRPWGWPSPRHPLNPSWCHLLLLLLHPPPSRG
jgi:hypothetical protein